MRKVITIFEDRLMNINLNSDEQKAILKLRELIGSNNLRVYYDGSVQVMHYVGFFTIEKISIQILPKVIEDVNNFNDQDVMNWSMKALYNMLKESEFNNVLELPEAIELNLNEHSFLEIFISIFARKVLNYYEKSIYREYKVENQDVTFIKGKININNTIKHNIKGSHLHNVSFDELTENNVFNSIIKTILLKLLSFTQSAENKKLIRKCLVFFDSTNLIELSIPLFDNLKFSRLNEKLRVLINMARMFYSNLAPEYQIGKQTIFSFLIPVNQLFEYYVYRKLCKDNTLKIMYQKEFGFLKLYSQKKIIKPDYIILDDLNIKYVGDAKYKIVDPTNFRDFNNSDLYQIYTYLKINDSKIGFLYYPQTIGSHRKDIEIESVESDPIKVIVKFIDLV